MMRATIGLETEPVMQIVITGSIKSVGMQKPAGLNIFTAEIGGF